MTTDDERIAEYENRLAEVYQPELDLLASRLKVSGEIVNTGGGCMAIEATLGQVSGTDHPLVLTVTTVDAGLAEERDEIVHWYACLYDGEEGGEALADGHDLKSFDTACNLALDNLRQGIPPSDTLCSCL
ncbi:hypothetical protein APR11_004776 [Nocardia amikacinitolerans]|uniref:hypothetical protein n=1 Tax=Nocardia amikacinitolerans TaxID=756689 RepID=UPI0020A477EA|nr:hypothetical protein [Nocardia amikacinitolerans]MCP2298331.1 hypothetical protein [Nocardia amikacinitolerans]